MTILDREKLERALQGRRIGRPLVLLERTSSTMDVARERTSEPGTLVVADQQDAGRGSRGRAWTSPPGTDLYVSFVWGPLEPTSSPGVLTLSVGLGVAEAISSLAGKHALVKWPNDVLVDHAKISGILVESSGDFASGVVVGIGINVNRASFPPELTAGATSLHLVSGETFVREHVLVEVLGAVERWLERYEQMGPAPVIEALDKRLAYRNERVQAGDVTGVVEGIARDGALLVRDGEHLTRVLAGRVEPCS
jgi:BirA family transcriptional regulator, biotin operon repressor / biotin---[acetyl-CoA-carboxylase] ligase